MSEAQSAPPPVRGAATFFYYDDLPRAADFYEHAIGLRKLMQNELCALFELAPGATLGLVLGSAGSQAPIPGRHKGAIVSLETEALEAWFERLKAAGVVAADADLVVGGGGRTSEFKVFDPEGYCLEFFRWTRSPAA